MPNPVVHFEIIGNDGPGLQTFYGDLFDWKITVEDTFNYGMVETGGEGGINGGISADPHGGNRVSVYVEVDDLQAYLDKAENLGAMTVLPPTDMGYVKIAIFSDPAGNMTGLIKSNDTAE